MMKKTRASWSDTGADGSIQGIKDDNDTHQLDIKDDKDTRQLERHGADGSFQGI